MKLVFIENNRPLTDSLVIAETFGKEHKHVMRDIRELECSELFRRSNFGLTPYVHNQNGQTYEKYLITQDGFSFLVMGYTGKEAARFKEMYINEFNLMKSELNIQQLHQTFDLPRNYSEALRLAANLSEENETVKHDNRILMLESEEQKQKIKEQEAKVEADRPKVLFAESLEVSRDSILIGELAKVLKQNGIDIGGTRLFKLLREEGYLMSKGEQYNQPSQRSMNLKIMEVKTGSRNGSDGTIRITRTTKITGKGQIYFINKFKGVNQTA